LEHCHNNSSPDHDNVSGTNDLPTDATTNHSRKTDQHLCLEQHKHRPYQESLSLGVVLEIGWVAAAAEETQCVYLQLPSSE